MILTIYPSQAKVYGYLAMIHSIVDVGDNSFGWLIGNKWIINCGSRGACETIQNGLGGTIDANMFPATPTSTPAP
jgi:hypothetical protein